MWHEARKQERLIRGMIVDYRRRAERRKDFYEKIKAEPTQFLQLHGRPCKIHLDPAVAAAGEGPAIMMPWQGDSNNMIDRFDVRAHLDYIPEIKNPDIPPEDLNTEERQCNYERYRILAQNAFLGISEDKFLQQLAIEEQFGVTIEEKELQKEKLNEKKGIGVAIGYNYSDPGAQPSSSNGPEIKKVEQKDSDDDSDLEIIDVDLSIDVNKMEPSQAHELNAVGPLYGMAGCDLFSFLTGDADDAEHQKQLLREEKEKALFSGRKSRRERRAHRDKKLTNRVMSPPSYAAPSAQPVRSPSRSVSRTPSPDTGENIQFITSFGGEDEEVKPPLPSKPLYADKLKQNLKKAQLYSEVARNSRPRSKFTDKRRVPIGPRGPNSRSRSFSRSRSSSSRSRSRSRTTSRSRSRVWRSRSYSKSRSKSSRSRSRSYRSRSRSRSWSRNYRRRSKSPTHSGYRKCDSRSMSRESNEKNVEAQPAVPRYYGRNKEDNSSSELSIDSDSSDGSAKKNKSALGNKSNTNQNQLRLSGSSSKVTSKETLTLKEKLKRKMQAQLSRQLRADKRAEAERVERESRRQARRDHEMRELAIKLRRKQREMRHQNNRRSSDDDSDRSHSESSSRGSHPSVKQRDVRSRSRSASSQEKHVPVWETNCVPTSTSYHSQIVYTDQRKDDKKTIDENRSYNYPNKFDRSRERGPNYESQSRCGDESGSRQDSESRYDSVSRQVRESRYASETRQEIQSRYDSGSRQEDQRRYHDVTRQDDQSRHGSGTRQDGQSRYDSGMRQDNESRYGSRIRQDYQSRYDDQSRHEAQAQDRWSSKSFSDRRKPFSNKESYREGSKNSENFSGHTTSRNNTDNKEMYNRNKVKLVDY